MENFEKIKEIMPEGWEEAARKQGALRRSRKIKNASDLLKLNLLYLTSGGSFGKTSAMLKLTGEYSLNKNAVYERIKKSSKWLNWLCENICRKEIQIIEPPEWLKGRRPCLIDATDEPLPGSNKADYRLHYCVELFSLKMVEQHFTKAREGEKLSRFEKINSKDIIIADRGYSSKIGMVLLEEKETDYIIRYRSNGFNLYDEKEEKVDLASKLGKLEEEESADITLYYKNNKEYRQVRICAIRKTKEAEKEGLAKIKKSNNGKMRGAVSERQSIYNRYVIVATSLPQEISAAQILELYRARWQIELVFKRFKSIFDYDEMPSHSSEAI